MSKTYNDLVEETKEMDVEEARAYLCNFFRDGNEDSYIIDEDADADGREAILALFENGKTYMDKINDSLKYNEYCKEAILLEKRGYEDPIVEAEFNANIIETNDYDSFSPYKKKCFHSFLKLYSDFLFDVGNITKSIKIFRMYFDLSNDYSKENMRDISFKYAIVEDDKGFYQFFLDHEFKYPEPYLLLISVLLKHEEYDKAKEVLNEMVDEIKYADYIYRMWELADNQTDEACIFKEAVDFCFDEMTTYPCYFSFCKENIDKNKLQS